jgi:hypothetical protein
MYEDLDPSRWGENQSILDHELVQMFFTAVDRGTGCEAEGNQEYNTDDLPNIPDDYLVIFDADSTRPL